MLKQNIGNTTYAWGTGYPEYGPKSRNKNVSKDFPGGPVGAPMLGARVRSLVGELDPAFHN